MVTIRIWLKNAELYYGNLGNNIYYYDAPPFSKSKNKPLNGGKYHFGRDSLTIHNTNLLKELAKKDYFALRMGEIRFRGWELMKDAIPTGNDHCEITANHLRPSLQQKGVDMRIGLDIASLSLKKQVDIIVSWIIKCIYRERVISDHLLSTNRNVRF